MSETGIGERDITRAHIQRSVGVVVCREVFDPYYAECRGRIPELTASTLFGEDAPQALPHSIAYTSQRVSRIVFNYPIEVPGTNIEAVDSIVTPYTYAQSIRWSMSEGVETIAHFPLRLALDVSASAYDQSVRGFSTDTLANIAKLIRRPTFRKLVDTAAFTSNGIWRSYSTSYTLPFRDFDGPPLDFVFSAEGDVDFRPDFKNYLRQRLLDVNKAGITPDGQTIEISASSGCPARRLRASFTQSEQDKVNIETLASYFSIPPEAVTATYDTSVINEGLDVLAEALEYAHPTVDAYHTQKRKDLTRLRGLPGHTSYTAVLSGVVSKPEIIKYHE